MGKWDNLPDEYRTRTRPYWQYHNLFPHSGMDTILGKGKKDISMLMDLLAMDDYLVDRADSDSSSLKRYLDGGCGSRLPQFPAG